MDLLKLGQKVSISFPKGINLVEMSCEINKVLGDRILLELPPYFMRYINFLEVGKALTVKVFSKLGTIDFNAVIITSPLEDDFAIELDYNAMRLTPSEDLPVIKAIEMIKIFKGEDIVSAKTFEISPNHVKFYSETTFIMDEKFDCDLILPSDYGTISFKATISDVDPLYDNEYTIQVYGMNEEDRQTLLYYMYLYSNNTN